MDQVDITKTIKCTECECEINESLPKGWISFGETLLCPNCFKELEKAVFRPKGYS